MNPTPEHAGFCRYAELVYNGLWFSPERQALQNLIDETQKFNSGTVRLKLYKVQLFPCFFPWKHPNHMSHWNHYTHKSRYSTFCSSQEPDLLTPFSLQKDLGVPLWKQERIWNKFSILQAGQMAMPLLQHEVTFALLWHDAVQTSKSGQRTAHACGVILICLQGNVVVVGRKSPYSLYDEKIASFEDDGGLYNQKDAAGFIKLQALRLRTLGVNRSSVSSKWSSIVSDFRTVSMYSLKSATAYGRIMRGVSECSWLINCECYPHLITGSCNHCMYAAVYGSILESILEIGMKLPWKPLLTFQTPLCFYTLLMRGPVSEFFLQ